MSFYLNLWVYLSYKIKKDVHVQLTKVSKFPKKCRFILANYFISYLTSLL